MVRNINFEINDSNWHLFRNGDASFCGGEPRLMGTCLPSKLAYGSSSLMEANIPLIPRDQWPDLIADQVARNATLVHVWEDCRVGMLDQDGFPFCHGFSAKTGASVWREIQGLPRLQLSASSIALPAAGWRKAGAAIEDDLQVMATQGIAELDFVPELTSSQSDFRPGWKENAAKHRITKWYWARARDLDQHISLLLSGLPCCNGLNYWGHAVCDLFVKDLNPRLPVTNDARWGIIFANSWGINWGDRGFAVRTGSKKYADQCYAPCQATAL